jgi:hypothetical protein
MKNQDFINALFERALIDEAERDKQLNATANEPISIHWEMRILWTLGIGLLSFGLGVLVYKNIETIGHQVIIAAIALAIILCGAYVWRKRSPFLRTNEQKAHLVADNILLLGCTLLLILEGYLQFQYTLFGNRFSIAALIPTLIFAACAYRFDHIGVLVMALTAFTAWAGLAVSPLSIFQAETVFHHEKTLIHTGIAIGLVLIGMGLLLERLRIKPHFTFAYLSFGYNLASVAAIYATSGFDKTSYGLLAMALGIAGIVYARWRHEPFFFLAGAIYAYIAFSILLAYGVAGRWDETVWLLYGVLSAFGVVLLFLNYKKLSQ